MEIRDNSTQKIEDNPLDDTEKCKAYRRKYMREYMKDRWADNNFKKNRQSMTACSLLRLNDLKQRP